MSHSGRCEWGEEREMSAADFAGETNGMICGFTPSGERWSDMALS